MRQWFVYQLDPTCHQLKLVGQVFANAEDSSSPMGLGAIQKAQAQFGRGVDVVRGGTVDRTRIGNLPKAVGVDLPTVD